MTRSAQAEAQWDGKGHVWATKHDKMPKKTLTRFAYMYTLRHDMHAIGTLG